MNKVAILVVFAIISFANSRFLEEEIEPKATVPNDAISAVEAPDAKAGVSSSYKFVLKNGFKFEAKDKIIFSTQDTTPSNTDYAHQLDWGLQAQSYSPDLIVPKEGNYNIFIERAGTSVKQTGITIKVGPKPNVNGASGFISITFAVLLGLFLF